MKLVEQHIIRKNNINYKPIEDLSIKSNNLYNTALFIIRQHYFNRKGKQFISDICDTVDYDYVNYYDLNRILKQTDNNDYKALPANVSQETLKLVDKNFKSFFKLLNKKTNKEYENKVNIPKYRKHINKFVLIFNTSTLSKTDNSFKIPKTKTEITGLQHIKQSTQIRIIPKLDYFVLEVIYEAKEKELKQDNHRYLSIDLGVNNLAACTSNVINSFIINGKPIKSINQYYNKMISKHKSIIKTTNNVNTSSKIRKTTLKRNNKIKWYMHNASKYIVETLLYNDINTLIVGKNKEWKSNTNIGKKNNQTFVSIPFDIFVSQLKYKCKLNGINMIEQEESYTSKVSFIDNDYIPTYNKDDDKLNASGKRIKRGLYQTKNSHYINADINGSFNIMRKYLNVASDHILNGRCRGFVVNPYLVTFK